MRCYTSTRSLLLAALALLASAMWAQSEELSLNEIVNRMQSAEAQSHTHAAPYTVTRQYVLSDPKTPDSRVLARVSFVPPGEKDFTLYQEEGSDRAAKIVRKVLDHETEMSSHYENVRVARQNYDFAFAADKVETIQGHRCYVLQILPRRETPDLVRGRAWVDAESFMIRRIQGQLASNPSWWIKDVNVTINYDDISGMWLQRDTNATATLRLLGTHTLSSRAISLQTPSTIVQNHPPKLGRLRKRSPVTQSAVWMPR